MTLGAEIDMGDRLGRRRCDTIIPSRPQLEWLQYDGFAGLWIDGNQIFKTTGTLLDLVFRCRGHHPYQKLRHKPPISAMLVGVSHEQLGKPDGVMEKLYELLPKDEIEPIRFDRGRGFAGKPPVIRFLNGSAITFGTFQQDPATMAGMTMHHIVGDEPIPGAILAELVPRLLRRGGTLRINFTPTIGMPPQDHLRELCTKPYHPDGAPLVKLFNHGLTAENTRPIGAPFPLISQASIDEFERFLPEAERPMRIRGSWDPLITDRHITAWDSTLHASPKWYEPPPEGAYLVGSWDHGVAAGKQVFVLEAFEGREGTKPRAWAMDMDVRPGRSQPIEDARAAVEVLRRNGINWWEVDAWVGDRAAHDNHHVKRKDNDRLRAYMAEAVGVPFDRFPRIEVPYKTAGSVHSGILLINALCADRWGDNRPCLMVHPDQCKQLAEAIEQYKGGSRDPMKDRVDAFRYGVEKAIDHHPALGRIVGWH